MPSPITRYTSGTFKNKKGVRIVASKKNPVWAYRRSGEHNIGAWLYYPKGNKKASFKVSIVSAGSTRSDANRAAQNPYAVSGAYRHTGDWVGGPRGVVLQNYPAGKKHPPRKTRKGTAKFLWRLPMKGKQRKTKWGEAAVTAEKKLKEAKKLKKQAVAKKEAAEKAKSPKVKKEKAAEAVKLATKAQAKARAVAKAPSTPKSVKAEAKGTARAAGKTKTSAKKVKSQAAKAAGV